MIGRRSTIGLALLCALAFSALVAQSAMAQKGTHSTNTTAFTCVEVKPGTGPFNDAHCDEPHPKEEGNWGHLGIGKNITTAIEVTNETTGGAKESATLKGVLGGVNTEVTCKSAASVAGKSFIHNVEIEKKHTVTGEVQINFTECEVKKPTKCVVKEPIVTTATFQGVEGLNEETKSEMGVEFKGVGEKSVFAELTFENKGAEKCALATGKPFQVLGSAIATGAPSPNSPYSGATSVYIPGTEKNKMETLEIGGNKNQEFLGTFTTKMAKPTKEEEEKEEIKGQNGITLTTTT